jgi:AcrR family transcriptional regulator
VGHHRDDVVATALRVLDAHGIADLSMRRLAAELDVRPSALYHHFPSKQALLAAVADEILAHGPASPVAGPWDEQVRLVCADLRDAVLAYRDGAELVATVRAFELGGEAPYDALLVALADAGLDQGTARVAARTLLHFVLGHATDEQTQLQAASAGAIDAQPRASSDFDLGLALVLDGLRARVTRAATRPRQRR